MATYIWELGIDWNAIEDPTNGKSYMPAGFIQPGEPSLIKRPHADSTDLAAGSRPWLSLRPKAADAPATFRRLRLEYGFPREMAGRG